MQVNDAQWGVHAHAQHNAAHPPGWPARSGAWSRAPRAAAGAWRACSGAAANCHHPRCPPACGAGRQGWAGRAPSLGRVAGTRAGERLRLRAWRAAAWRAAACAWWLLPRLRGRAAGVGAAAGGSRRGARAMATIAGPAAAALAPREGSCSPPTAGAGRRGHCR